MLERHKIDAGGVGDNRFVNPECRIISLDFSDGDMIYMKLILQTTQP